MTFAGALGILMVIYGAIYHLISIVYPLSTFFYACLILSVLFVVTLIAFVTQLYILKKAPDYSIHIIVSAIIIRLLLFGVFNFFLIWSNRSLAVENVVLFFAVYLGFTLLELVILFRQITGLKAS